MVRRLFQQSGSREVQGTFAQMIILFSDKLVSVIDIIGILFDVSIPLIFHISNYLK